MKLLFYTLLGLFLLCSLPFVVARVVEVSAGDEGLWPSSPYSGATPDCPEWHPAE